MHALLVVSLLAAGCYHYSFEQRQPAPGERLIRYVDREPTWLNGLVGTGSIDARQYCADPVRTELKVNATDVLISIATLLIYTPHTLYVTCGVGQVGARQTPSVPTPLSQAPVTQSAAPAQR